MPTTTTPTAEQCRIFVDPSVYLNAAKLAADYSLEHGYMPVSRFVENRIRQQLGVNPKFSTNPQAKTRITLSLELVAHIEAQNLDARELIQNAIA